MRLCVFLAQCILDREKEFSVESSNKNEQMNKRMNDSFQVSSLMTAAIHTRQQLRVIPHTRIYCILSRWGVFSNFFLSYRAIHSPPPSLFNMLFRALFLFFFSLSECARIPTLCVCIIPYYAAAHFT